MLNLVSPCLDKHHIPFLSVLYSNSEPIQQHDHLITIHFKLTSFSSVPEASYLINALQNLVHYAHWHSFYNHLSVSFASYLLNSTSRATILPLNSTSSRFVRALRQVFISIKYLSPCLVLLLPSPLLSYAGWCRLFLIFFWLGKS